MRRIITATFAIGIAGALALPSTARACSLPYVDDANGRADGAYNVTLTCAGLEKAFQLRVTDCKTGKRVEATRHGKNVWLSVLKPHRAYKVSARGVKKHGKTAWKTIRYQIG